MREEIIGKIRQYLKSSLLSEEQRALFMKFVHRLRSENQALLLDVIKDDPETIGFLCGNLQKKIDVFQKNDKNAWQAIVKEEGVYLTSKRNSKQ